MLLSYQCFFFADDTSFCASYAVYSQLSSAQFLSPRIAINSQAVNWISCPHLQSHPFAMVWVQYEKSQPIDNRNPMASINSFPRQSTLVVFARHESGMSLFRCGRSAVVIGRRRRDWRLGCHDNRPRQKTRTGLAGEINRSLVYPISDDENDELPPHEWIDKTNLLTWSCTEVG